MRKYRCFIFTLILFLGNCTKTTKRMDRLTENNIDKIIQNLTIEEKARIITGSAISKSFAEIIGNAAQRVPGAAGSINPIDKLGIPGIVLSDGPAGVRIWPIRENDDKTYYATAFPVGTELACTWNKELVKEVGEAIGNEAKEYGIDIMLGPALNIHRNPLCGRNFEYYSEDPLVSGKIAAAMVKGIQSKGVGTSIKHFVANNQETNRLKVNVEISERAMREIYLKGFEIAVKESGPWTVMSSYNKVNGTYVSSNHDLLTKVLRDEWGYEGFVMTDWYAGYPGFESLSDSTMVSDVAAQVAAGNDVLMPGTKNQYNLLVKCIKDGSLPMKDVDASLKRILNIIVKSPYFKKYAYSSSPNLKKNAEITRQAATEGMVLLKNNKAVLPYTNKETPIAIFGNTSYAFISGGTGSGDVNEAYTVSLIEGLTSAGYSLDDKLVKLYSPYVEEKIAEEKKRREKEGILSQSKRIPEMSVPDNLVSEKATSTGLALITIGRNSGEGSDRVVDEDFNLATDEIALIDQVSKAFHAQGKKVVVILNIGGVIETASWKDKVDGILLAWQPGQEGGNSVADVFSGIANPSGKLTMTFPVNYDDTPSAKYWLGVPKEDPLKVTYEEDIYVGYRYFNTNNVKPSYEFGYGLSYTQFEYKDLKLDSDTFNDKIIATVNVANIGAVSGKEVIELYITAPGKSLDKPILELKAFSKTKMLEPGQTETVSFEITADKLASFEETKSAWVAEAGEYKVKIGASCINIKQEASFNLEKELIVETVTDIFQ